MSANRTTRTVSLAEVLHDVINDIKAGRTPNWAAAEAGLVAWREQHGVDEHGKLIQRDVANDARLAGAL